MIPSKLEDWNYDVIKELADNSMEGDTFDFKYSIKSKDHSENDNLIQTVCAFANTKSGYLIFGVHRDAEGHYEIRGLDRYDNYAKEFGDKISAIDPTVYFTMSSFIKIPNNDKILFVVYIPLSPQRPHMISERSFYFRTNRGNEIMGYNQVKDEFLKYDERRYKLRLLYTELLTNKLIAESLVTEKDDLGKVIPLTEFETDVIINLLPDIHGLIQDDSDLLRALLNLRIRMSQTNARIELVKSYAIRGNHVAAMISLNVEINTMVGKEVLPKIAEIREILETKYDIKNPLQD